MADAAGEESKQNELVPKKRGNPNDSSDDEDNKGDDLRPRKKFYRCRAHANPYSEHSFAYPVTPEDWAEPANFYPHFTATHRPEENLIRFADIGCGFGGLLFALSPLFPDKLMLGMEIRPSVCQYVVDRAVHMRKEHPGSFENIYAIRTNAMKYLPNYFRKGQLEKMFFLFPDPHFKKKKQRRRIISPSLLSEYAYFLQPGGLVYTATDVRELHDWMALHLRQHPLFEELTPEEISGDVCVAHVLGSSEEAKKVQRNAGDKFLAVFRRITRPSPH